MASFSSFQTSFEGDIITESDREYDKAISRWCKAAERKAKYVAFVKNAEDVSLALRFALSTKLDVAIRGGGHSVAGASSSKDGIVIDLSRYLGTVRIDPKQKRGHVGGGAIWETVDKEAIKYGLATVGGTVNHVCN